MGDGHNEATKQVMGELMRLGEKQFGPDHLKKSAQELMPPEPTRLPPQDEAVRELGRAGALTE